MSLGTTPPDSANSVSIELLGHCMHCACQFPISSLTSHSFYFHPSNHHSIAITISTIMCCVKESINLVGKFGQYTGRIMLFV